MQDVLQEQLAQSVYKALKEQGGHIYVCGDVTMAGDVFKAIQRIVRQQGQLSAEEAGAFISKLRVSSTSPSPTCHRAQCKLAPRVSSSGLPLKQPLMVRALQQ